MLVVHVQIRIKPEAVEDFIQATLANARASVKEPGIARFDVVQREDDPTRFVLVEAYRNAAGRPQNFTGLITDRQYVCEYCYHYCRDYAIPFLHYCHRCCFVSNTS